MGKMKLALRVAVYNGGTFWKECWESIKENLDIFDGVYISVNCSESQEHDIELIKNFSSDKIKWRKEDQCLSSVAHGVNIDKWLGGFQFDGHILILCHDDILNRNALLRLKEFELKQDEAVWLGASFFYGKNIVIPQGEYADIVSEQKISSDEFFRTVYNRALNVSRIIIPFSVYEKQICPWQLLSHGYGAEVTYLCNPCISYIQQMSEPGVKIRRHANSEGCIKQADWFLFDSIFVQLHTSLVYSQAKNRIVIARHIFFLLRNHPLKSIAVFFAVLKQLRRLEYCSFKKIISVLAYIPLIPFRYIGDYTGRIIKNFRL